MTSVSARSLNILAALVWHVGGIVLLLKGGSLLSEATALRPGLLWPWVAGGIGLLAGGLKARHLFGTSCARNLARIARLEQPRIWQFFTPRFLVALALMILAGATLSSLAQDRYALLIGVAALDLGIAVGLLGSSYVFWQAKVFSE